MSTKAEHSDLIKKKNRMGKEIKKRVSVCASIEMQIYQSNWIRSSWEIHLKKSSHRRIGMFRLNSPNFFFFIMCMFVLSIKFKINLKKKNEKYSLFCMKYVIDHCLSSVFKAYEFIIKFYSMSVLSLDVILYYMRFNFLFYLLLLLWVYICKINSSSFAMILAHKCNGFKQHFNTNISK